MKVNSDEFELHYSNWVKTFVMVAKPRDLFLFAGRGTAKSTDILAARSEDMVREMPNAPFVFTSDTYMNLMTNVLPSVMKGWEERYDMYEGVHYVVDEEPPQSWKSPFVGKTFNYKHTISTYNGCKFFLTSLDRPSANAGLSVVHVLGDEAKYLREPKLNKLFPTLRGNPKFYAHSPYFLGKSFTSDIADPIVGEDDWMLRMEDVMNIESNLKSLRLAYQSGLVVNEIEIELYQAMKNGYSERAISNIRKNLKRWNDKWTRARKGYNKEGTVYFDIISSYANADILTERYFKNLQQTLDFDEFKKSVLSMRKSLSKSERFYPRLDDKHFYSDGINYDGFDNIRIRENITNDCTRLRYLDRNRHLECGVDFGNMLSLVIGQQYTTNEYKLLKEFYTLPRDWMRELCTQFIDYFKFHKEKVLLCYYDRSGNQNAQVKQDNATKFKNMIETDRFGVKTGWKVKLMSIGQGNILHSQEYDMMNIILGEDEKRLPSIRIDQFNCSCLKSSLENARRKAGTATDRIQKDKTSEKLPTRRLPKESTNFSDAFKYLICRTDWLRYGEVSREVDYTPRVY